MIAKLEMAGLFLVAGIVSAMGAPLWRVQDGTVLPPGRAKLLLDQCSRDVPRDITGVWQPQAGQISELEKRLPSLLESKLAGQPHPDIAHYARQYAGLIQKDRRIIYVNGFWLHPSDPAVKSGAWRMRATMVCDGGNGFFGVEYDPKTKVFTGLAFNGVA